MTWLKIHSNWVRLILRAHRPQIEYSRRPKQNLAEIDISWKHTVYPKKYAHGFCFAVLCCGYTLTDFPISIRLTSLALWQSNDCPSASKATLMNMDKYFMWIHYERLHNHNKAKHILLFMNLFSVQNCHWNLIFYIKHYLICYVSEAYQNHVLVGTMSVLQLIFLAKTGVEYIVWYVATPLEYINYSILLCKFLFPKHIRNYNHRHFVWLINLTHWLWLWNLLQICHIHKFQSKTLYMSIDIYLNSTMYCYLII